MVLLLRAPKPFSTLFLLVNFASLLMIILIIPWIRNPSPHNNAVSNKVVTLPYLREASEYEAVLQNSSCLPEDKYDQLNTCLIRHVRQELLLAPPGLPLNLPLRTTHDKQPAIKEIIDFLEMHFIQKDVSSSPGFFIECGANNGEFISNTLGLERKYNWTGLLIEPNPAAFRQLVSMHRNVWAINQALCTTNHSDKVKFFVNSGDSGPGALSRNNQQDIEFEVTCVPLYTILRALNITTVDYFSLDIQGVELEVLKTLPLDKVIFKTMNIEHGMVPGGQKPLRKYLEGYSYKFIGTVLDYYTRDSVFVHESVFNPNMVLKLKYDNITG